ncbi:unnamed protein product [Cuscuta epithymum]|uniref:Uncharacterized protein n=1 Tax=Cuscuta epithymum TaxID=186058 RepID=A0AAV0FT12_9ASTE|nr:unnamed protein product [Cuscuta epithymum]
MNMAVESQQWPQSLAPPRPLNPRINKRPFITLTPKHEALEARKNRTMARQRRNLQNSSADMSSALGWPQQSTAQSSPEEQPQGSVTVCIGVELVLQKVLKRSDVHHGRIVLPKKEAEFRLPRPPT